MIAFPSTPQPEGSVRVRAEEVRVGDYITLLSGRRAMVTRVRVQHAGAHEIASIEAQGGSMSVYRDSLVDVWRQS
jgi:hypothetical protein